jgi:hypothetical protein
MVVADSEADASVHRADLARRFEPLQVAAHGHVRDPELASQVGDGEDADLAQAGQHPGTALRPGLGAGQEVGHGATSLTLGTAAPAGAVLNGDLASSVTPPPR